MLRDRQVDRLTATSDDILNQFVGETQHTFNGKRDRRPRKTMQGSVDLVWMNVLE